MLELIRDYLPWLLSGITVWMTLLAGNLHRSAWLVGLAGQALWLVWIVAVEAWGLIPLNAVLWVVYLRNHFAWAVGRDAEWLVKAGPISARLRNRRTAEEFARKVGGTVTRAAR